MKLDMILTTPTDGRVVKKRRPSVVPHITCADGTTLSVQASNTHCCEPRNDDGPWTCVEVGFPSVKPPRSWKKYAENWSDPTGTVYAWVPVEVVRRFIKTHGGER